MRGGRGRGGEGIARVKKKKKKKKPLGIFCKSHFIRRRATREINRVRLSDEGVVGSRGDQNTISIKGTTSRINIKTSKNLEGEEGE